MLADQKGVLQDLEIRSANSLPPAEQVMRAFAQDPNRIRVVILGQDPYPTLGDAIGLAFAVSNQTRAPRSLINIFKELEADLAIELSRQPDISNWEKRGVLLLNSSLTTLPNQAGSHSNLGWHGFTKLALTRLAESQPYVLLAWGNHSKELAAALPRNVQVLHSAHPSPLSASRGFFGSKPFSRANAALLGLGLEPIDWSL